MKQRRLGIAVIGFGWMGQAHSRGYRRVSQLFTDAPYQTDLVVIADDVEARRDQAIRGWGFSHAVPDWRAAIDRPDVDVVSICAPNMLHEEIATAAAAAGKHVFCEKPVGGTPEQTVRAEKACRNVITGVGYNYRWAPLVQYTKRLIDSGDLGAITNYRGTFFSMYGADPLGLLSWRFQKEGAGYGVSSDILSHTIDLAMMLNGPITQVFGTAETFIKDRPLPKPGVGTHYDRGAPGDPTGPVTNEDYFGAFAKFANGARGTFEVSRSIIGPESQNAFDVHGTAGAVHWNLERMNEIELYQAGTTGSARGYQTVYAGGDHPYHGAFVAGTGNGIAYEDLVSIEDHEYLTAVAEDRRFNPGFAEAVDYVSVQAALLKSHESGRWETVVSLRLP
jgi:predicted dehydrogenase